MLLTASGAAASPGREGSAEVRVLLGPDSPAQRQALAALRQRFGAVQAEGDAAAFSSARSGVCVALGPAALRQALQHEWQGGTLVSVFTSCQTYRQLLAQAGLPPPQERVVVPAIYAEPAPGSQFQLIAALFERRITVGVLLTESSAMLERAVRQSAAQNDMGVQIEFVAPQPGDVARGLQRLAGSQALLAVADSTLYTPDMLRLVLETTYRRGLPVVGFSNATVAAGTLATATSTVEDVVADLADLVHGLGSGPLPEPRFPRYWRVALNERVARSLGFVLSDRVRQLGNFPAGKATP